jgi:hypothetical protein
MRQMEISKHAAGCLLEKIFGLYMRVASPLPSAAPACAAKIAFGGVPMRPEFFHRSVRAIAFSALAVLPLSSTPGQQSNVYGTYQPNQTTTTPVRPSRTEYADPSRSASGSPQYVPVGGAASNLNGGNNGQPPSNREFENNGFSNAPTYQPPDPRELPGTIDEDPFRRTTQGTPRYNPPSSATDPRNSSQPDPYRDPRGAPADASFANGSQGSNTSPDLLTGFPPANGYANDANRLPFEAQRTQSSIPDPLRDTSSNTLATPNLATSPGSKPGNTTPMSLLLLLASISANVYLGWIAFDTYNRYQELVGDIKMSRSRRERGPRQSERDYSSDDAEVLIS